MSARIDIFLHRLHLFEGCKWIPKPGTLHPSMVRIAATAFAAARK